MALASIETAVDEVIRATQGRIRLGLPLGLGKPNAFVNALYRRVAKDPALQMDIYTALSLSRPRGASALEQRFLAPFVDRVYGDYEELAYLVDLKAGRLPANITVSEFFFHPGSMLANAHAQHHYISSNYTHAARDLNARGVNVVAQMLACERAAPQPRYSLSCNPEVTLDLLPLLMERRAQGEPIVVVGQVQDDLPFMGNDALIDASLLDILIDDRAAQRTLYSVPNMPVTLQDHAIGLHASLLVRDGGTLQVGIGSLGDALAHQLLLRQGDNAAYRKLANALVLPATLHAPVLAEGGLGVFAEGLYGCSEMITEAMLALLQGGVIRRAVGPDGTLMHGGFFLGSRAFYQALRELPAAQRAAICMTRISEVNHLYGDELRKRTQRRHARFINTVFTATLLGAGVADQLEDGRVLSGVGGQYNFVSQAHELQGARSILLLRSWRERGQDVSSNIVWQYGHITIPRHLRDIVVTEYGIADLRGRNDSEVIAAMLSVADSRFQEALRQQAVAAGKLPADYRIPEAFCGNTPESLAARLGGHESACPEFPLGTDFDATEQQLLRALRWLKEKSHPRHFLELGRRVLAEGEAGSHAAHLRRMGLEDPRSLQERFYRSLVLAALQATA